jgi:succinyl-diaminopimelate desuccinylase
LEDLSPSLDLAMDLIRCKSISPADAGCQSILAERLTRLGFHVEPMPFADVENFWAHFGADNPTLVFAGHTDVVPTGPVSEWHHEPFEPVIIDGFLYGRGAADMKGSLACFIIALEQFLRNNPEPTGSIGLLITSDEEADAINGTIRVMETLSARGVSFDMCVVGEPSSSQVLGDVIRVGRRGSLNAKLTVRGIQGHVAYANDADNPIHRIGALITELAQSRWDQGNSEFPPTSFQISNIHSGTGATNVIPGKLELAFNFRYSTESTAATLQQRVVDILKKHQLDFEISWQLSGEPFLTRGGLLIPAAQAAIKSVMDIQPELSTSGGTSDGRFIAPAGVEVIELGPSNSTIHKVNERVSVRELDQLTAVYLEILNRLVA